MLLFPGIHTIVAAALFLQHMEHTFTLRFRARQQQGERQQRVERGTGGSVRLYAAFFVNNKHTRYLLAVGGGTTGGGRGGLFSNRLSANRGSSIVQSNSERRFRTRRTPSTPNTYTGGVNPKGETS